MDINENSRSSPEPDAAEPWRQRWLNGQTGWDQGREHTQLERLIQHASQEGRLISGARIFSAGCGRAHNEAWLARKGYCVQAVDLVPEAIESARALYGHEGNLQLATADVFAEVQDPDSYDAIFDRAMLCAIQPSLRSLYLQKVADRLKADGLFMSVLFRKVRGLDGPPFAVDEGEALALLSGGFNLCHASTCPPLVAPHNVLEEWLCIWRKKS